MSNIDTEPPGFGDASDEPLQHRNAFVYRRSGRSDGRDVDGECLSSDHVEQSLHVAEVAIDRGRLHPGSSAHGSGRQLALAPDLSAALDTAGGRRMRDGPAAPTSIGQWCLDQRDMDHTPRPCVAT